MAHSRDEISYRRNWEIPGRNPFLDVPESKDLDRPMIRTPLEIDQPELQVVGATVTYRDPRTGKRTTVNYSSDQVTGTRRTGLRLAPLRDEESNLENTYERLLRKLPQEFSSIAPITFFRQPENPIYKIDPRKIPLIDLETGRSGSKF